MVLTMTFTEIRSVLYLPFQRIKEKVCLFFIIMVEVHAEEVL